MKDMGVWLRVTGDFDFFLDAPGEVSDRDMDALLAYLGIEVTLSAHDVDWWAGRVAAAAEAGPARLLAALSEKDLRRIAAFTLTYCLEPVPLDGIEIDDVPTRLALHIAAGGQDGWAPDGDDLARFGRAFGALLVKRPAEPGMVAALMLCAGAPGETLTALPWAEPEWDTPVMAVDSLLHRAPAAHVEWLHAMAARHPDHAPALADSAARTEDTTLVEPYGIALLAHHDIGVRRAAVGRLSRRWRTDAYQDAVAALLTDADLAGAATDKLAALLDRRCLPLLVERVARLDGLRFAHPFGAELLPHVLAKLAEPLPPKAAADLLLAAAPWGEPPLLMRPEAAALVARLRRLPDADGPLINIAHRISLWQRVSDEMRTQLRVLATDLPLRVRQHAQWALLETGETDWLVPVLLREITAHPVRTGADGPHRSGHGWRADATACAWLGRLGATEAVPVLRALLSETGEPGAARPAAALAYWRITGDTEPALSTVEPLVSAPGDLGVRAREAVTAIRA